MPTWKQRTSTSPSWSYRPPATSNQQFYLAALFGGVSYRLKTVDGSNILIGKVGSGSNWKTRVTPS